MKVVIECKDNKYRYIVSEITHISKTGTTNGGRIDNLVPDCGSASMDDLTWKKVKSEAMRDAALVVSEIKEVMQKNSADSAAENW
jgi:negative regulator of replication initiation